MSGINLLIRGGIEGTLGLKDGGGMTSECMLLFLSFSISCDNLLFATFLTVSGVEDVKDAFTTSVEGLVEV